MNPLLQSNQEGLDVQLVPMAPASIGFPTFAGNVVFIIPPPGFNAPKARLQYTPQVAGHGSEKFISQDRFMWHQLQDF